MRKILMLLKEFFLLFTYSKMKIVLEKQRQSLTEKISVKNQRFAIFKVLLTRFGDRYEKAT